MANSLRLREQATAEDLYEEFEAIERETVANVQAVMAEGRARIAKYMRQYKADTQTKAA